MNQIRLTLGRLLGIALGIAWILFWSVAAVVASVALVVLSVAVTLGVVGYLVLLLANDVIDWGKGVEKCDANE